MQRFLIYLFLQTLYMFQAVDNTWSCTYSYVLLMMSGGTAWNM